MIWRVKLTILETFQINILFNFTYEFNSYPTRYGNDNGNIFIVLGVFFIAGLDLKVIFGGLGGIVCLIAIIWNSPLMKAYWKGRLLSFLNPEAYSRGLGFQLSQSLMAIGSGKIVGQGFTRGLQIAGNNVPEAHTDFIFAVVGNEWGLVGVVFLLFLYGVLIYKFIKTAKDSKDIFGTIVTVGVISTFLFSIFQNIGMTIGLMPITGITLPLMSYGEVPYFPAVCL